MSSATSRSGFDPKHGRASHHGRGRHRGDRDLAGADRGVRADRLHSRHFGPVLSAVRHHHRGGDGDLGVQFADACRRRSRRCCSSRITRSSAAALLPGALGPRGLPTASTTASTRVAAWLCAARPLPGRHAGSRSSSCSRSSPALIYAHRLHAADGAARLHPDAGPGLCDRRRAAAGRRLAGAHRRGGAAGLRRSSQRRPASTDAVAFAGFSGATFTNATNAGVDLRAFKSSRTGSNDGQSRQRRSSAQLFGSLQASRKPSSSPCRRRRSAASAIPAASRCSSRSATAPTCGAILQPRLRDDAARPTRRPA